MGLLFTKEDTGYLTVAFGRQNNPYRPFNSIRTTKYSLITFLPKALILQFMRAANIVYLISAVLQSISIISSLSPITAIGPLMFVLFVGIIRQAYEDYKRHSKDVQVNQRQTLRLQNGIFTKVQWKHIKAGDIIKVLNNQVIPCDMVLLYSTEENSLCYVETSNLDGQANLKTKYAFVDGIVLYPDQFDLLQGTLDIEKPSSNLYEFNGRIKLLNHDEKLLAFQNILLRETHLKNTAEAVGVAVYCGIESKIMMNKGHIQHKLTRVEKKVNFIQLILMVILIILCAVCATGYYLFHSSVGRNNFFYLKDNGLSVEAQGMFFVIQAVLIFFTCFLLLNFLIPISLNVLLEFIKAFQTGFLTFDNKFDDEFCDGIHVGNMSIMEQLGVIDYILTDKTGTLTANKMIFRSCCIQDKVYSRTKLQNKIEQLTKSSAFHNFWLAVVICHDLILDKTSNQYQGSSPDQVCFVDYAKTALGYEFIKRTKKHIQIKIRGQKVVYELLEIIPFSSRRRMSVIVKAICEKDQILIFTKGADSAIFQKSLPYKHQVQFQANIDEYAIQGLRTLVFGYRKLSIEEFQHFQETKKAIAFLKFNKSEQPAKIEEMELALIEETQLKLHVLGATAIQDKLQDQVPQTIARLQQAGITIMMITGDKLQTAQNIGYLTNLIKRNFKIHHIRSSQPDVRTRGTEIVSILQRFPEEQIGLIIEGSSIKKIVEEDQPQFLQTYIKLLKLSTSIIFCRSSPKQKALIVNFVRRRLKGIVLAIGDGGNDIGMIEQANVGVGILGREGNSAAAASDFYFGQFKHLDRLLLHHGRWFYMRISYFFVYYGWKNLLLTVMMFIFIIKSAYSGFPAFSEFFITMYNLVIGMYLIGYYGVWQQDINDDLYLDVWEKLPQLYKADKQRDLFSYKRYIIWTIMGVGIAVVLDFFVNISFAQVDSIQGLSGFPVTYDSLYVVKSACIIVITLLVLILDLKTFTWYTIIVAIGIFTFGFLIMIYCLENLSYFGRGYRSLVDNDSTKFYLVLLIVSGVTISVKMIISVCQFQLFPSDVEKILKEKSKKGFLSIGNLNPHINPKDLLMNLHSRFFSEEQSTKESKRKKKEKKKKRKKQGKQRLGNSSKKKDRIMVEIQLYPYNRKVCDSQVNDIMNQR